MPEPLASGTLKYRSPLFEGHNDDLKEVVSNSLSQSTEQTPLAGPTEVATDDTPKMKDMLIHDIVNKQQQFKDTDQFQLSENRPKTMYTASFAVAEMEIQSRESSPKNKINKLASIQENAELLKDPSEI